MSQVAVRAVTSPASSAGFSSAASEGDDLALTGDLVEHGVKLPIAESSGLGKRVPGGERDVQDVEIDRDVEVLVSAGPLQPPA